MSAWEDEANVELLKTLWAAGLSASQIAMRIPGVTRNAVIGKRIRLGLPDRLPARTGPRAGQYPPRRRPPPRIAPTSESLAHAQMQREAFRAEPDHITPPEERKPLEALDGADCRYPYGDGPFLFCGKPKVMGKPYCPEHCMRAFDVPTPRRRAPQMTDAQPVSADRHTEAA